MVDTRGASPNQGVRDIVPTIGQTAQAALPDDDQPQYHTQSSIRDHRYEPYRIGRSNRLYTGRSTQEQAGATRSTAVQTHASISTPTPANQDIETAYNNLMGVMYPLDPLDIVVPTQHMLTELKERYSP